MKAEEIANFLGVDSGAVEFILSNNEEFFAYVSKNLRFDVVKPRSWPLDLFLWNEWANLFDIPIILNPNIYWVCSAEKPIAPREWVDFLIKNIIYLNKIYSQCSFYEGRHERVKLLGESAIFYINDLDILRFISELCFPNNLGISFKWYELSRKAILSLENLSEAKRLYRKIPYDLTSAFLRKLKELVEEERLPIFIEGDSWIKNKSREERIKYQEDYIDSVIESLLSLSSPIDVERKLSYTHSLLRVKAVERWVEEKTKLLRTPLEAKKFYIALFRREKEVVVLNKWKLLSREAILSLGDRFEAKKLYVDCHPDLKPAIIVFLSSV